MIDDKLINANRMKFLFSESAFEGVDITVSPTPDKIDRVKICSESLINRV